jgi:hypothetical protein
MADKPTKPIEPPPTSTEAEKRAHAEANAAWSAWISEHPEDDKPAEAANAEPRGDGTSPRSRR